MSLHPSPLLFELCLIHEFTLYHRSAICTIELLFLLLQKWREIVYNVWSS